MEGKRPQATEEEDWVDEADWEEDDDFYDDEFGDGEMEDEQTEDPFGADDGFSERDGDQAPDFRGMEFSGFEQDPETGEIVEKKEKPKP